MDQPTQELHLCSVGRPLEKQKSSSVATRLLVLGSGRSPPGAARALSLCDPEGKAGAAGYPRALRRADLTKHCRWDRWLSVVGVRGRALR